MLKLADKDDWAIFVGQWPPTFLLFGLYQPPDPPQPSLRVPPRPPQPTDEPFGVVSSRGRMGRYTGASPFPTIRGRGGAAWRRSASRWGRWRMASSSRLEQ